MEPHMDALIVLVNILLLLIAFVAVSAIACFIIIVFTSLKSGDLDNLIDQDTDIIDGTQYPRL